MRLFLLHLVEETACEIISIVQICVLHESVQSKTFAMCFLNDHSRNTVIRVEREKEREREREIRMRAF